MRTEDFRISHPEGVTLQQDTSAASWIAGRLESWGVEVGTPVCAVVPTGYDAYVRIFHHVPGHTGTDDVRRRWSEVARMRGRRMHPLVQFDRFGWDQGPRDGSLDWDEARSLVAVLRRHTSSPEDCWHAIWTGYGMFNGSAWVIAFTEGERAGPDVHRPRQLAPPPDLSGAGTFSLPGREYYLYRGSIDAVPEFEFRPGDLQTPNLWWPEDRAWFVATEIEFDSTIVGCSRPCAAALRDSGLEVLEVLPESRLDRDGDTGDD